MKGTAVGRYISWNAENYTAQCTEVGIGGFPVGTVWHGWRRAWKRVESRAGHSGGVSMHALLTLPPLSRWRARIGGGEGAGAYCLETVCRVRGERLRSRSELRLCCYVNWWGVAVPPGRLPASPASSPVPAVLPGSSPATCKWPGPTPPLAGNAPGTPLLLSSSPPL